MKLPEKEHAKVYLPLAAPQATRAVNTNGSFRREVRSQNKIHADRFEFEFYSEFCPPWRMTPEFLALKLPPLS
jgi:hypothetical protein